MSKETSNHSISYLKAFFLVALIVIFIGVAFKLFSSYSQRSFTDNIFNILIISDKYVGVVGIDESGKRFSSVVVTEELDSIKRENIMLQSVNFGIPIHGLIRYPEGKNVPPPAKSFFDLGNIQRINIDMGVKTKSISFFDWIKLAFSTNKIDDDRSIIKTYRTIRDVRGLLPGEDENLFRDSTLSSKKTSLQVINGTNINGLGTRIGEMYSRMGFNVVSILTEDGIDDSHIYYTDNKVEADAFMIGKSFNFPIEQSSAHQVAEVTIIIGEDSELELENLAD